MRRLLSLLAFLCCISFAVQAQNLVPNPSFEINPGCPTGPCEWQRATSWNNVNMLTGCGSYGTPDYYHTCGAGFSRLPYNGYLTCNPHTGNAVIGFLTWSGGLSPNFRELVSTRLTTPMIAGTNYTVSFWICNAFTPYYGGGSNHVGLDFSTAPLAQGGGIPNLVLLTPEYEIPGVFFSSPWVNFTFAITPTANWEYITFGNFFNDASTTATLFYAAAPFFRCYYFLDDVSIQTTVITPVKLQKPTVNAYGHGSEIMWVAEQEEGIKQYTVERSLSPAEGFEDVATTSEIGKGNYRLEDNTIPEPGTWYYKIRALDANGQSQWSEITAFDFSPKFPLIAELFPNPIAHYELITLRAWLPKTTTVNLEIFDIHGRQLSQHVKEGLSGTNEWQLATDKFVPSNYLLRLSTPDGAATKRFVVQ